MEGTTEGWFTKPFMFVMTKGQNCLMLFINGPRVLLFSLVVAYDNHRSPPGPACSAFHHSQILFRPGDFEMKQTNTDLAPHANVVSTVELMKVHWMLKFISPVLLAGFNQSREDSLSAPKITILRGSI